MSFYPATEWLFNRMKDVERRLGKSGAFESIQGKDDRWGRVNAWADGDGWFRGKAWGRLEDDHIPFLKRGVEILHGLCIFACL